MGNTGLEPRASLQKTQKRVRAFIALAPALLHSGFVYNARPTINGSTVPIARISRFVYGNLCKIWRIALSRARFLQSDKTTAQGQSAVSVCANIASLASVYSSHLSSDAKSTGLSFHCLSG